MDKKKYVELDAFRPLDSAPQGELDETGQIRANARLQQILASDPDNGNTANGAISKRRSRPVRRIAAPIALAAVAAITASVVLLPGAGSKDAAYASWNAVPGSISSPDRAVADAACRGSLDLASPQLDLAERRGDWVVLLYTASEHMAGMCLAHLPAGAQKADNIDFSRGGGDQGFLPVAGEFTQGNIAEFRGGNIFGFGDRPEIALTHGNVGEDVVAVTITTPDGQLVEATVQDGRYAAWWPGKDLGDELEGNGGPATDISYTITLNDQTVIENATPRMPS
ncbi:hypothetical protein ACT3UQ_19235 [Glutamicibacter sp. AOP12-B1-11]|uniref:hypothetical protein n=1 Tax=Glutamicibacter sp. AOP12-B1-11 TaxID=3457725 RepID=UPI0040337F60